MAERGGFEPPVAINYTAFPMLHHRPLGQPSEARIALLGGDRGIRTHDLYVANVPLYQLSYIPKAILYYLVLRATKITY